MKKIRKYLTGRIKTALILLILLVPFEVVGAEYMGDIMQYSSTPPFLPQATDPNILFLLDTSYDMLRPAYGICDENLTDCENNFLNINDDYDSHTAYYGLFDNGYSHLDDIVRKKEINTASYPYKYDDSVSYKYSFVSGSKDGFQKTIGGAWNGNWLNWLAMTQFDVMKMVIIGGNISPVPETAENFKDGTIAQFYSKLNVLRDTGYNNGLGAADDAGKMYKVITEEKSDGRMGGYTNFTTPQMIHYKWIDTPASATAENQLTEVFGSVDATASDVSSLYDLPFELTIRGTTYTQFKVEAGGRVFLVDPTSPSTTKFYLVLYNQTYTGNANCSGTNPACKLEIDQAKGSAINTFVVGTAPNRVFIVSYEDLRSTADTGKLDPYNFQSLIFESSGEIVFQYQELQADKAWGGAPNAYMRVWESGYEKNISSLTAGVVVNDGTAYHVTPGSMLYEVVPGSGQVDTKIQPANVLSSGNDFITTILMPIVTEPAEGCDTAIGQYGTTADGKSGLCMDHPIDGLFQEMRSKAADADLGFRLAVMLVGEAATASDPQNDGALTVMNFNEIMEGSHINDVMKALRANSPSTDAPLAEGLAESLRYYQQESPLWSGDYDVGGDCVAAQNDQSDGVADPHCNRSGEVIPCCRSFVMLISSGNYTNDFGRNIFDDDDHDTSGDDEPDSGSIKAIDSSDEWKRANGGWLDNVAYKLHVTDMRDLEGEQDVALYVVNTYGESEGAGREVLKRAAMYGGFNDKDRDDTYDAAVYDCSGDGTNDTGEDDRDCDGLPDTYFEPSGDESVKDKIAEAINAMLKGSASGTSVSVLSTSAGGQGAVYQAYFYPSKIEGENETRDYTGYMRSFFMDKYQNLRDDASGGTYTTDAAGKTTFTGAGGRKGGNAKLDTATIANDGDYVSLMHLDTESNMVRVYLTEHATGKDVPEPLQGHTPNPLIDELVSVWEAGEVMATRVKENPRKLYTWADINLDGVINGGGVPALDSTTGGALDEDPTDEIMLFNDTNSNTLARFLRADDPDGAFEVISGVNTGFLNMTTEAEDIIDFIRGEYVNGYRNRCITIRGNTSSEDFTDASRTVSGISESEGRRGECGIADGESDHGEVWPLGDIIYSTPTLVSGPGERYDEIYGDASYLEFKKRFADRRNVIYVGANDGMLHAFNAGFFHADETKFCVGNDDGGDGKIDGDMGDSGSECASNGRYKLGEEMWGFIPHENLPHLQFLACNGTSGDPSACGSSDYHHVFFMDQRPKATDVKIFANDSSIHPGGWGTIIVVGMRYGGGAMDIDFNGNGTTDQEGEKGERIRSAYYVFDVTDPEEAPVLLYRFTDENLGFTTSYPAIARTKEVDEEGNTTEAWFVVFGSGPKNEVGDKDANRDYNSDATTTQAGYVYVYELGGTGQERKFDTTFMGHTSVIMGDPSVIDVNLDFSADVIYIGSSQSATDGKVYRINTGTTPTVLSTWPAMTTLFEHAGMGPLYTPPSASMDDAGNFWVYFGTGRLRNSADIENTDLQTVYAIKDDCWENTYPPDTGKCSAAGPNSSFNKSQLYRSNEIKVELGGLVTEGDEYACGGAGTCSFQDLITFSRGKSGWYFDLVDPETDLPVSPSERVLARSVVLGKRLMFTTYSPLSSTCDIFGTSNLYALYYETGSAYETPTFMGNVIDAAGNDTGVDINAEEIQTKLDLGAGMPTAIGIAMGETVTGFVQKSTGEIIRVEAEGMSSNRSGRSSWREKSAVGGTVEIEETYKHIVQ